VLSLLVLDRFAYLSHVMAIVGLASTAFWISKWLGYGALITSHLSPQGEDLVLQFFLISYGSFFALGVFLWLSLLDRVTIIRCVLIACLAVGCLAQIKFENNSIGACIIWLLAVLAISLSVRFNSVLAGNPKVAYTARVLGLTTYPLYLLHNGVGAALIGFLFRSGLNRYAALTLGIEVVVVASVAIALVLEPMLKKRVGFMLNNAAGASHRVFRRG
jgi:peptidoglycan/LPS O-acetylase OafA/YrhL